MQTCLAPARRPAPARPILASTVLALTVLAATGTAHAALPAAESPAGAGPPWEGCRDLGTTALTGVEAGGVLALADGSRAVLAGLELPRPAVAGPAETAARQAVEAVAGDAPLHLFGCDRAIDRHGRRLVQAVTADGRWLQAALVRSGWARVAPTGEGRAAARRLLPDEAAPRRAGHGLWGLDGYRLRRANEAAQLIDSLQVVEGQVAAARRTAQGIELRLGRDERRGLTLQLPARVVAGLAGDPALAPFAARPLTLAGHWLRVRGWIGKGRGPLMEVAVAEQIELADRPPRRAGSAGWRKGGNRRGEER